MGDGSYVELTRSEIRADAQAGSQAAAARAKVPPLDETMLDHIVDIYASTARFTGVDVGTEVVLSYDGCGSQAIGTRINDLQTYEQMLGADILELWHMDYCYKAARTVLSYEQGVMRAAQRVLTAPVQYGAMPDLGRYTKPDGSCENWSELMPLGRVDEARAAQEEAAELAARDIVSVCEGMAEAGADGFNLDTAGAAGDGDLLAALNAAETLRARHPDLGIEMGMAGECTLGMHGQLTYKGTRLAGMWPHQQVKVAEQAGVHVWGPAVNVNTGKSCAWNIARAVTLLHPACEAAEIAVHANVGMGVCGVPMTLRPPVDAVCRASRTLVDLLRLDGL
jgi:dimethylamine--corrinoid protein Co-methyltransferase